MKINRYDPATAISPPEPAFTGDVRVNKYFSREPPSSLAGALVHFAPGARTPWKINPLGQTLVIIAGKGRAQQEGGGVVELQAGDVVWCPPGVRHWDGAAPDLSMTYLAMQEKRGAVGVSFFESVSDEAYQGGING